MTIPTAGRPHADDASLRFAPGARAGLTRLGDTVPADARSEDRVSAAVPARVRTDRGVSPGCIRDISPHGAMLSMAQPPRRGEFVEVVTAGQSLIGQVRWVAEGRAGLALRETIGANGVFTGQTPSRAARQTAHGRRPSLRASVHDARDSQVIARQLQFAAVIAFGAVAGLIITFFVNDLLSNVINRISNGLPG